MVGTGGRLQLPRSESQKIDHHTLQSKFGKEYDASIHFCLAGGYPMTTRRTFLIAGVGAFAVPLTACGGGESDSEATGLADPSATPPQAPPITPPPPTAPPPPGPPSTAGPPGYEDPIVIYDG